MGGEKRPVEEELSDELTITPLGAGQEVGRSCILLQFKGKRVLLDIGIHPGLSGLEALPFIDVIDTSQIDLLLVSHFHLDHCGALPYLLEKTSFKGRTFMTHATKAIYKWLLADYIKVSNISTEDRGVLYTDKDLDNSLDKIETLNFHEEKEVRTLYPLATPDSSTMGGEKRPVEEELSDELTITPLGAGQEVGRSCILLQFKGKRVLLDIGIHPGLSGLEALPFIDVIDTSQIDLLLVSHFHLDHCGALPYLLEKTSFKGRTFMTHATKAIYKWLLADYIKVSNISTEDRGVLYTDKDLDNSLDKIETLNFHEEKEVNGIKFWSYNAGHVLGAAMFMIEIAGVKILYTGDFSREEDRHLMAAEVPNVRPDICIIESTYGTHIHEKREVREARFTQSVHETIKRDGRCLIPVFALG
eukprot:sb/3465097/